jgi:hypothetical protein
LRFYLADSWILLHQTEITERNGVDGSDIVPVDKDQDTRVVAVSGVYFSFYRDVVHHHTRKAFDLELCE